MFHFVYKTTNPENNKYYIGKHSTLNIDDGYIGSGLWIRDCRKAKTKLERFILKEFSNENDAYKYEEEIIKKCFKDKLNMNFKYGGLGMRKYDFHIHKKISLKLTGIKRPEHSKRMKGKNNPNYGKPKSEETKRKIGLKHKGKKLTKKHKQIIRLAQLGRKKSIKVKKKQSIAIKNWWKKRKQNESCCTSL